MQYPQVVQWVNGIVPDMRKGDPAAVLLSKAAAWRDPDADTEMPVAVLEKAAQIFNQGVVIENNAAGRRGETQDLIDIDRLVSDYVMGGAKSAAAKSASISPALSTTLPNITFGILAPPDTRKAASAAEAPAPVAYQKAAAPVNLSAFEEVLADLKFNLDKKAADWKRELLAKDVIHQEGRHLVFSSFGRIEADGCRINPWISKAADWLADRWSKDKVQVALTRATAADHEMHKLAHDYTGHAARLIEIGDLLAQAQCANEFFTEAKQAAAAEDAEKVTKKSPPKPEGGAPEEGGTGQAPPEKPQGPANAGGKPPAAGAIPNAPTNAVKYLKLEPAGNGQPKPEEGKGDLKGKGEQRPGLVGQVLNMGGNAGAGLIQKVLGAAGAGGGDNSRQRMIDESVRGVQELQGLQRLMQTDPVISKANPELVAELFATIRRAAPGIAADPALLRFQLRESIQYGGMPAEGYGQLAKTRELDNDNRENERREDQARYSIKTPQPKKPSAA